MTENINSMAAWFARYLQVAWLINAAGSKNVALIMAATPLIIGALLAFFLVKRGHNWLGVIAFFIGEEVSTMYVILIDLAVRESAATITAITKSFFLGGLFYLLALNIRRRMF